MACRIVSLPNHIGRFIKADAGAVPAGLPGALVHPLALVMTVPELKKMRPARRIFHEKNLVNLVSIRQFLRASTSKRRFDTEGQSVP